VIAQPDLEAWLWSNIEQPGVTSFAYAAQVMWPGWVVAHHVQVDARARRKQAARDLAEQVRQAVMALPDVPWADGTVCYVQPTEGPFWLPDPDGHPRYVTRYEIRVHPARSSGVLPLAALAARPPRRKAASPRR
jgi:GAF domain-containing protein